MSDDLTEAIAEMRRWEGYAVLGEHQRRVLRTVLDAIEGGGWERRPGIIKWHKTNGGNWYTEDGLPERRYAGPWLPVEPE